MAEGNDSGSSAGVWGKDVLLLDFPGEEDVDLGFLDCYVYLRAPPVPYLADENEDWDFLLQFVSLDFPCKRMRRLIIRIG